MTREVILIFGKTGSGKTVKAKSISDKYERKVIIDSMYEYHDGLIFYDYESFAFYLKRYYDSDKPFSYILRFNSDPEYDKMFIVLFAMRNYLLIVEEAELYISPMARRTEFNKIVRYGRHKEISILGIARRASELSQDFKAQVNKIYSFVQTNPIDLQIMRYYNFHGLDRLPLYAFQMKAY